MANFKSFYGVIDSIEEFWTGSSQPNGCYKLMSVQDGENAVVNFVVSPDTYFVDHAMMAEGDTVIGFYDADLPVPLIYPPQYRAVVMAKASQHQNVTVDFFDETLLSSDGMLELNLAPSTMMLLENGQRFTGDPANRNLIVVYGPTTRSIPAQTTPYKLIVMC